jgi:hypothetical protein
MKKINDVKDLKDKIYSVVEYYFNYQLGNGWNEIVLLEHLDDILCRYFNEEYFDQNITDCENEEVGK